MRPQRFSSALAAQVAVVAIAVIVSAQSSHGRRMRVAMSDLCVSEGTITDLPAHGLMVAVPNVHATLNRETPQDIEARFVYLGPTEQGTEPVHAGSHHQFGFELFAQDACNLVYVAWRLEPESSIAVLAKSNSSQHIHADCRGRGTTVLKPELALPLPAVRAGERLTHTLHAQVSGAKLFVFADNVKVWEGTLPAEVLRTHGPVGIHCDNARLQIVLTVAPPEAGAPLIPCVPVAESK